MIPKDALNPALSSGPSNKLGYQLLVLRHRGTVPSCNLCYPDGLSIRVMQTDQLCLQSREVLLVGVVAETVYVVLSCTAYCTSEGIEPACDRPHIAAVGVPRVVAVDGTGGQQLYPGWQNSLVMFGHNAAACAGLLMLDGVHPPYA